MRIFQESITSTTCSTIVHGCNNRGTFGAGVAKAIAEKWPQTKTAYLKSYESWNQNPALGSYSFAEVNDGQHVFNLVTQDGYGRDGKKYARYWAVAHGLINIIERHVNVAEAPEIAIPRIGCGFGGLDWFIVEKLLLEIDRDFEVDFWVYDPS